MKKFKIETDGTYYYPYIRVLFWWKPIENYEVRCGNLVLTGSNKCDTLERAKFLIQCIKDSLKREENRAKGWIIWIN